MIRYCKTCFLSVIFLIAVSASGYAQQFPILDQYLIAPATISPAFVGKNTLFQGLLTSRIEWTSFKGHPFIGSLHLDGKLPKNMGVGGNIMYNQAGPLENMTINVSYAYHLRLAEEHYLSFGINGTYYQNMLDLTGAVVKDPNDPLLAGRNSISENYVNAGISLLYSWKTLNACIAFPLLFNNRSFYTGDSVYAHLLSLDRNFLIYLGYTLQTESDWGAQFTFLYRQTQYTPWSFDISARAFYKDKAWLGLLYRKNNTIGITGGVNIIGGLKFNYTYEYSPTAMLGKTGGTHEITLGYSIVHKKEKPLIKDYIK